MIVYNQELAVLAQMQELLSKLELPGQCRVMNWMIDEVCEKRDVQSIRLTERERRDD